MYLVYIKQGNKLFPVEKLQITFDFEPSIVSVRIKYIHFQYSDIPKVQTIPTTPKGDTSLEIQVNYLCI